MDLVALKVKITRGPRRRLRREVVENLYPDFNRLPPEVRTPPGADAPMDWSYFVSHVGFGWLYDEVSGFGFADAENPDPTVLYGVIGVPPDFAAAAELEFPELVEVMEPEDFVAWRASRSAVAQEPEVRMRGDQLAALHSALELAKSTGDTALVDELQAEARRALDPDDSTPGRNRNRDRDWGAFAARRGIQLVGAARVRGAGA